MSFGFGIVGCGMIAKFHARAIADLADAELVACTSATPSSAERFGAEFGCQSYPTLEALLSDKRIDAVCICTPSGAHREPAIAAANAGKHVIVEKPLEVTLERCDEIILACSRNQVTLVTIFPSRFHESAILMKEAVEQGRFGTIALANAYVKWFRTQAYYDSGAWRGTLALDGGGALMNQAIHSVDLLSWFMGPVTSISGHTNLLAHERIEVEDVAVATLKFANGALGTIEASTAAYPGYLKRIEIYGSRGSAVLEEEDIKVWDFADSTDADRQIKQRMEGKTKTGGGAADPAAIGHHGHRAQLADAIESIQAGRKPRIDGPEGRKSVEIILAVYAAAREGKTIRLPL